MSRCKYWDSGYCYHKDFKGWGCIGSESCGYFEGVNMGHYDDQREAAATVEIQSLDPLRFEQHIKENDQVVDLQMDANGIIKVVKTAQDLEKEYLELFRRMQALRDSIDTLLKQMEGVDAAK